MEFIATFKLHITPKELERLEFYRIHNLFKEYEAHIERENKEYEKQKGEAEKKNNTSFKAPPMPTNPYGNFKAPTMPNFQLPKF